MPDEKYREVLGEIQLTIQNLFEMNAVLRERCRVLEESNYDLRREIDDLKTALETANNLIDSIENNTHVVDSFKKACVVIESKTARILELKDKVRMLERHIKDLETI